MKKKLGLSAALAAAAIVASADAVFAADVDAIVTKAPVAPITAPAAACGSVYDFFLTACPLSWYGVTLYGAVDLGGSYMTHGAPLDKNWPAGLPYILGSGGTNATGRTPGFYLAPNALSQSNIGLKVIEPVAAGFSFVAQFELAFDPYTLTLANNPQAIQNGIGVAQNQQATPIDGSRWGWLNTNQYVGFTSPIYGTVTFGRQNTLGADGVIAYDSMGGAYGFSLAAGSGKTAGAGDTEDARWTTAIKYRENIGDFRLSVMLQPFGLWGNTGGYGAYNPNNGAIAGGIGGDVRRLGPGTLSLDAIATFEKDANNITTASATSWNTLGWPTSFPSGPAEYLKATISNQTAVTFLGKYSFGSWGNSSPPPVLGKAAPPPSGPTGIPLTLYAGYEWIQFANPSDPQTVFRDDGFLFNNALAAGAASPATAPSGTIIQNNGFNTACGSGSGCEKEFFQTIWGGAKYGITKDLDVSVAYYHYIQSAYVFSAPGAVCNIATAGNSRCAGTFDDYSLLFDWRFLPKWTTYVGLNYSAAFGGLANNDITRNNLAVTGGVRFRF
jgi:predicted porin